MSIPATARAASPNPAAFAWAPSNTCNLSVPILDKLTKDIAGTLDELTCTALTTTASSAPSASNGLATSNAPDSKFSLLSGVGEAVGCLAVAVFGKTAGGNAQEITSPISHADIREASMANLGNLAACAANFTKRAPAAQMQVA